jgi:AcrR family transcriptional regulator
MGRPREHDDRTRVQLLDAAEELLARAGPEGLTIRAVADAIGVTTRAVYSTFGGKEGLIRGLYLRGFEMLGSTTRAQPRSGDPEEDLRRGSVDAYRSFAVGHPQLYRVMFETLFPEFVPSIEDAIEALDALASLRELITRCADAGSWPESDVEVLTLAMWSALHGLVSLEHAGQLGPPDDALAIWRLQCAALVDGYRLRARQGQTRRRQSR